MLAILDILRHGQALPAGDGGDRQRRLSPAGTRALERLAQRLVRRAPHAGRVFSSPYARALETAGIVAGALRPAPRVETLPALVPGTDPAQVLDALAAEGVEGGHVMVVGHQPLLGLLVAHLTGVERELAPGTLVRVRCPRGLKAGGSVEMVLES